MILFSLMKRNVKKYQAVVFDLDDTLFPESEYVLSGLHAASLHIEKQLGIPAEKAFSEMREIFHHGDRSHIFDEWLLLHNQNSPQNVTELIRVYREHDPVIQPFPDVPPLLQALKKNHKLALLSDGFLSVQKKKLAALDLSNYFDVVIFSDEWGRDAWKPNPATFRMLAEKLNVNGRDAIYVADNPLKDFKGARSAGMDTIRFRYSGGVYAKELAVDKTYEPDFEFISLNEIRLFLAGS